MHVPITELLPITRLFLAVLLHFVWQATLIVTLVAIGLSLIRPKYFRVRYLLAVLGLAVILLAPMITVGYYIVSEDAIAALSQPISESGATSVVVVEDQNLTTYLTTQFQIVFGWFDSNRNFWLGCWLSGFVVLLTRLCLSLGHCFRLRRHQKPLPPHLKKLADGIKRKLDLTQNIIVGCSHEITQAVATGVIKPVVLIPAAWITQLPVSAIEAILAHELAHVKRWDLWINLLQRFAETIFFFHPLIWWLSHKITSEREVCCDQLAIRITGRPMHYVKTLAHVAGTTTTNDLEFKFGTAFIGDKNMNLLRRAKMILEPASVDAQSPFRTLTFMLCLGLLVCYGSYAYCKTPDPAVASIQDSDHPTDHEGDVHQHARHNDSHESIELVVIQEGEHPGHDGEHDHLMQRLHEHLTQLLHDNADQHQLARKLRELADHLEVDNPDVHPKRDARRNLEIHQEGDHSIDLEVRAVDNHPGHRTIKVTPRTRRYRQPDEPHELHIEVESDENAKMNAHDRARAAITLRADDHDARQNVFVEEIHVERADESHKPREMIIEVEADENAKTNAHDGGRAAITLRADDHDARQNVFVEEIHVQRADHPHATDHDAHFGHAETSDGELGRAIRDLKNEVQQLRHELNQLRSERNSGPNPRARREGERRPTDRSGRFEIRGRDDGQSQKSLNDGRWDIRVTRPDANDAKTDAPSGNIWIESSTKQNPLGKNVERRRLVPDGDGRAVYRLKTKDPSGGNRQPKALLWVEEGDAGNSVNKQKAWFLKKQPKQTEKKTNPLHWFGAESKNLRSAENSQEKNDK